MARKHDDDRDDDRDEAEHCVLGWREWAALPDLGIKRLKIKIDTGARTSALFARDVTFITKDGEPWVEFVVYPRQRTHKGAIRCEAPVIDVRDIRSSTGHVHRRAVIRTELVVGEHHWPIEVTLAKRKHMKFRMLLGREGLAGHCQVDVARSYLQGKPHRTPRPRRER